MKKFLFVAVCVTGQLIASIIDAQTLPKYVYSYSPGFPIAETGGFYSSGSAKLQWIYRPSELPGLPAGPLRSVYFRVGFVIIDPDNNDSLSITHNPTIYDSVRVKMGSIPIQDTTFKDTLWFGQQYSLMKRSLTQVFFQPKVTIYGADSIGTWVRFPIDEFSYNPGMNLVVELDRGYQAENNGFGIMTSNQCTKCALGTFYDSARSGNWPRNSQADIGFDDATGAVGGLVNLKGFYTYPNPSEGLFTVGFEPWGTQASTVQVSVSDMAGRQVWQRSYQGVQASLFTTNVDLRGRPKGIYLLRVQSGDAQALQRVVVE